MEGARDDVFRDTGMVIGCGYDVEAWTLAEWVGWLRGWLGGWLRGRLGWLRWLLLG